MELLLSRTADDGERGGLRSPYRHSDGAA